MQFRKKGRGGFIPALFIFCAVIFSYHYSYPQPEKGPATEEKPPAKLEIEVISEIKIPSGYHEGLFISGNDMWVNNGEGINTWVIDTLTGEMKGEIKPPGTFTEGVTIDNLGRYWITDWNDKKLYETRLEDGAFIPQNAFSFEPSHTAGVVYAEDNIYLITWTRGMGTVYHLIELDMGGVTRRKAKISGIFEPSQIGWDGKHLWITSWYSGKVYKIDRESFAILGYFVSPVKDATGIVFDGEHCWLTGTKSNLYKLKIL